MVDISSKTGDAILIDEFFRDVGSSSVNDVAFLICKKFDTKLTSGL
jgi:hypothetical protein